MLTASYFGLARVEKWAAIPEGADLALNSETTWKGLLMPAATILTAAFLLGTLQLFWWSAAHPWVETRLHQALRQGCATRTAAVIGDRAPVPFITPSR